MIVLVAGLALVAGGLLMCPAQFSEAHRKETGLLKTAIAAMALVGPEAEAGRFPTMRGVEIRNLVFYLGAAVLTLIGGIRLISCQSRPMLSRDDFWNWRERAGSPLFWWGVLLAVSVISSAFSNASDVSMGQSVSRMLFAAWWWPIAALLLPMGARRLSGFLVLAVGLCALMGLWHFGERVSPGWFGALLSKRELPGLRLEFPIGNSLWFGGFLLPAIFVALGLGLDSFTKPRVSDATDGENASAACGPEVCMGAKCKITGIAAWIALPIIGLALVLTQARSSAWVGLGAGVISVAFFAAGKKARPGIVLAGLLCALAGVWYIQGLRQTGEMGERAHSIRTRLNYEWPYALTLFSQKPVGGHGEGGYTMLAPQFSREDQIDEPSTMAFSERWWYSHAHNEFLELLADLGAIGAGAFILALGMTLYYAVKYCDIARADVNGRPHRMLVIGLAAGLFAMMIEECSSVGLRNPGLPPIFLTVWAILWALIRSERRAGKKVAEGDQRLNAGVFRGAGLFAVAASFVLGFFGVQDWRAIRASYEAQQAIVLGETEFAAAQADFAGENLLDPFQRLCARMYGIDARSRAFADMVSKKDALTDEDLLLATDAWMRLERLGWVAPRFLNLSRFASEISANMARAYQARGEAPLAQEYRKLHITRLAQWSNDDPFNTQIVQQLWGILNEAAPMDRLLWLRRLMRRGEMDDATRMMAEDLFRRIPGSVNALNGLAVVAMKDANLPAGQWSDRLSPETLRLYAQLKDWGGEPAAAEQLAKMAEACYAKAGPALFAAHSAVIRESVVYALHASPTSRTDELLRELVRAHVIMNGPMEVTEDAALRVPLPDEKGITRVLVLAAAGRDEALKAQLKAIAGRFGGDSPTPADVYVSLADQFVQKPQFAELTMQWAKKAAELDETKPLVHYTLAALYLNQGDDKMAEKSARRFIELLPDRDRAFAALQDRERRRPESPMWARLRSDYPDFPELPLEAAPTSQPSSQPSATGAESDVDVTSRPK
ncbi:MAG: O-antigen ligase family protein [Planctomycetes bacterium]|nr:O-antigen ligase family protein [Planctomycetota bacterium]